MNQFGVRPGIILLREGTDTSQVRRTIHVAFGKYVALLVVSLSPTLLPMQPRVNHNSSPTLMRVKPLLMLSGLRLVLLAVTSLWHKAVAR